MSPPYRLCVCRPNPPSTATSSGTWALGDGLSSAPPPPETARDRPLDWDSVHRRRVKPKMTGRSPRREPLGGRRASTLAVWPMFRWNSPSLVSPLPSPDMGIPPLGPPSADLWLICVRPLKPHPIALFRRLCAPASSSPLKGDLIDNISLMPHPLALLRCSPCSPPLLPLPEGGRVLQPASPRPPHGRLLGHGGPTSAGGDVRIRWGPPPARRSGSRWSRHDAASCIRGVCRVHRSAYQRPWHPCTYTCCSCSCRGPPPSPPPALPIGVRSQG